MSGGLAIGGWAWAAFLIVGAVAAAGTWLVDRGEAGRRRALLVGATSVLVFSIVFVIVPELALRGWIPGTVGLSPCEESPGSGCAACTAEREQAGLPTEPCYRRPLTELGRAIAGIGPLARGRTVGAGTR